MWAPCERIATLSICLTLHSPSSGVSSSLPAMSSVQELTQVWKLQPSLQVYVGQHSQLSLRCCCLLWELHSFFLWRWREFNPYIQRSVTIDLSIITVTILRTFPFGLVKVLWNLLQNIVGSYSTPLLGNKSIPVCPPFWVLWSLPHSAKASLQFFRIP